MRIYVANLAKYNDGRLVGRWIDLPIDPSDLQDEINSILGNDEEYAIHDYEAPFRVEEYSNPFRINQIAELDDVALERFTYLVDQGYEWDYALDHYEDVTFYQGASLRDVADEMLDEGCFGEIPESVRVLIDVDRVVDQLDNNGYQETDKGTFYYS